MGTPKLHNLVMVLTPPEGDPVGISLTVPEPGALRLRDTMGAVQHGVVSQPHMTLASGFQQLDSLTVNAPTPANVPLPQGGDPTHMMVLLEDLEAIAVGDKIVALDDGLPVIIPATGGMFFDEDQLRMLATGKMEILLDANGDVIGTAPKEPDKPSPVFDPAALARDPALNGDDPKADPTYGLSNGGGAPSESSGAKATSETEGAQA